MKIILVEERPPIVVRNGKKGRVIDGTFIELEDQTKDDGVTTVTPGAQGTQDKTDDNSGVTTVTPGAQGNNKGAQGTQTNGAQGGNGAQGAQGTKTNGAQGAQGTKTNGAQGTQGTQVTPDQDSKDKVNRTGKYSTDSQGRDYDDPEYGQPPKKEPPKPSNPSGKKLPTPKDVRKGSARERMINKNIEIHGADKIIALRNKNAAFQATKNRDSGYTRDDFIKDFPNSNTAKNYRARKGISNPNLDRVLGRTTSESYDAYDLVLDYVITEGHAENQDEANYVMMQMSPEQIQHIVSLYEV